MIKKLYIAFCLMSLSSVGSLATQNSDTNTSAIKKIVRTIVGKGGTLFGLGGTVIDWISTSIYNYCTKHNDKKYKWYRGPFFIYGGRKFKITKNVYLDVYYSLIKLIAYYIIDFYICNDKCDFALVAFITININIHIYKNFYLSIAPIHWILYGIICLIVPMCYRYPIR